MRASYSAGSSCCQARSALGSWVSCSRDAGDGVLAGGRRMASWLLLLGEFFLGAACAWRGAEFDPGESALDLGAGGGLLAAALAVDNDSSSCCIVAVSSVFR